MVATDNIFKEMKDALTDFKVFLDKFVTDPKIKALINALDALDIPVKDLITQLVDLMVKLKAEILKLDPTKIDGLGEAVTFTAKITQLMKATRDLVPAESAEVDEVLRIASLVTGLGGLNDIKQEILALMDAIIAHLNTLKTA